MKKTIFIIVAALIISLIAANSGKVVNQFFAEVKDEKLFSNNTLTIKQKIADPQLHNPSDLIRFQGKYVVAELLENRLAYFDDLSLNNLKHFDPKSIGKSFASPHFLSMIRKTNSLLMG